ncbi:MAG: hypothetical protein ABIR63_05940 [Sphingomicrobium sp.]
MDAEICGKPVIVPLLGGTPKARPERYRLASPIDTLPVVTKEYLASAVLSAEDAEQYRAAAKRKGQAVDVLTVEKGGHFDIIAPGSAAWIEQVKPFLAKALAGDR